MAKQTSEDEIYEEAKKRVKAKIDQAFVLTIFLGQI